MSYIIGFISQKGGVGKSTLVRALACEMSKNKLSVKVSDLDIQQATTFNWHRKRLALDMESSISVECHSAVHQSLKSIQKNDILIIDGPARASKGTLDIAKNSDLVVQPTGASLDDLEPAILTFHELVKAGISKKSLVFALVRVGTVAEELDCRSYIEQAGYDVLDGCVFEKPAYRQSQNKGLAVTETKYISLNNSAGILIQAMVDKLQ
jgi:chromosome partitioning protein